MMDLTTRSIEVVTGEILVIKEQTRSAIMRGVCEIGTRLEEAKSLVAQGEWTGYLRGVLHLTPSTAQNYMRIAREFGGGQIALDGRSAEELFGDLGYSQLLPLLGLPEAEREELAEHNELAEMSSREIKKLVADFKAAEAAKSKAVREAADAAELADKAEKAAAKADKQAKNEEAARTAAEAKAAKLDGRVKELLGEIEELKNQPAPIVGEVVPSEEELEAAREEARAEMAAQLGEAQERAAAADAALVRAKNPLTHRVNFLFEELRAADQKLSEALNQLAREQPETAAKFNGVIDKWFEGRCG